MKPYCKLKAATLIILAVIFVCSSLNAQAARRSQSKKADEGPPWYQVEVVVFANKQQLGLGTETWPADYPATKFKNVIDLAFYNDVPYTTTKPPELQPKPKKKSHRDRKNEVEEYLGPEQASTVIYNKGAFVMLGRDQYQLGGIAQNIHNSSDYQLLLHIAWRQPTHGKKDSVPVFVFDGMQSPDRLVGGNTDNPNMALEMLPVGPNYHRLSGTFRLSVARYLHLEANLHYKQPMLQEEMVYGESGDSNFGSFFGMQSSTPNVIEREVLKDFNLFESRRMRSKEIHYYDHPMLSVVAKVIPYEFPEEPEFVAPKAPSQKAPSQKAPSQRPRRQ
ncbi:MAG: peptidoglycan binding protein CsiV [Gammaproteobacteria bacterium]|nr:peptidoglycan binding protein CsiV [Gammaproteobacteria bacterium]MDH5803005.1 peptidoglycan binding protein CsiV [Gammaproteobacteria bacterium]